MKKSVHKKLGWFMNIADKFEISRTRCCPCHYIPHKLPIGRKVCDEPCHFHEAKWRMAHHKFFCQVLRCKNYNFMITEYAKHLRRKKLSQKS